MTTVSFPITLTGNYQDGSVCSAADYRADFEKMRDAINHMHERFSSFVFSGTERQYWPEETITHPTTATKVYYPSMPGINGTSGLANTNTVFSPLHTEGDTSSFVTWHKILNVMQIPSWMQGLRVRELQVVNASLLGTYTGGAGSAEITADQFTDSGGTDRPLKFVISKTSSATAVQYDNFTATEIASVSIGGDNLLEGGPYTTSAASDNNIPHSGGVPISSANNVVAPGEFLVLSCTGGLELNVTNSSSSSLVMSRQEWCFHANALCDAMVPVL